MRNGCVHLVGGGIGNLRNLLVLSVVAICAAMPSFETGKDSRDEAQEVIKQIENGQIGRVAVFQATDILTNHRMAPVTLTYSYTQKLDYEIRTQAQKDALISLLKALKVRRSTHGADVRVGIVFSGTKPIDNREDWKYGIFSDEFGKYGYMGKIGSDWRLDAQDERGIEISGELWNFASQLFTTIKR